ncbi:MAG: hypothetical protein JNM39_05055 [Bdellovibrionaceae bacterium]|nr:hypothetical protein [Pseudobdellovibrionaceae bacterium]
MKLKSGLCFLLSLVLLQILAKPSLAAEEQQKGQGNGEGQTSTVRLEQQPASRSRSQIILNLKSTNGKTDRIGVPNFNGKQEITLGYRFLNGWGANLQAAQTRKEYRDSALNKWSVGDPSFSLLHPDLYKDDRLTISGYFRAYIPWTNGSKKQDVRQYAYYATQNYKFDNGFELTNQLIPRFLAANKFRPEDPRFYIEDRLALTRNLGTWGRWGVGQWAQLEMHSGTETGYSIELVPQFDFLIGKNTSLGPRFYMPIFAQNAVIDGPKDATLDEAKAELYFQTSL